MSKNAYSWKTTSGLQRNSSAFIGTGDYFQIRLHQDTAAPSHPIGKRYLIKLEGDLVAQGFYLLLRSASLIVYPNDIYFVSQEQLDMLRAKGILFKFLDPSVTVRDISPVEI